MKQLERIEIRLAIEDLNTDFCHFLDFGMVDELVDLFTKDARYSHGKRVSLGHGEIRKLFTDRNGAGVRTSRHLQTGLKVDVVDAYEAEGKSVCLTFACDEVPPVSPATPFLVADFIDKYQFCEDGRWRIQRRHIERIFTAPQNNAPIGYNDKS